MTIIKPETSGGKRILDHGTVITFGDASIEFDASALKEKDKAAPKISFDFLKKEDLNVMSMEFALENQILHIKLYNIESSIDSGNVSPVPIGNIAGKSIFLNFRVRKTGESRTVDYTVYQE